MSSSDDEATTSDVEALRNQADRKFKHLPPEVEADIVHRRALSGGDVAAIVRRIRTEIATVSAQEAWSNSWSGEGELPDYSRVESGLESLIDEAHHDAVVELGQELFEAGQDQVERSHDDGETGMAIADCMAIVFRAVLKSSILLAAA